MATEAEPEFIPTTNIECEDKDQKGGEFDRTVYKSCQEELKKVDDRIEKLPGTGDNSANADTMKEAAVGALTVNTVFTGDVGNMQGESFLKSTSVAKVACEETCSLSEHDQTDKILNGAKEVSEYRNQQQKDLENEAGSWENKGMETTKEIAEKGNGSLDDVNTIGTGSQKTEIVEPAPKVGGEICEEERDIDQPVQTVDDQQTSVEENPETPKEALSGSEEDKKRETKMEEHTESESTEQFYNIIEATLSQNKEAFYYGPDSAEDSLDKEVETVTQVCDGEESIEKSFSAKTTLIGEELEETNPKEDEKKSEKPYSTAASEKGSEAIGASENEGDEKREVDQINCDGFTDDSILILKPNPGKQNNETIVEIGESAKETVDGPPLTLIKEKTPIEVGIEDKNNLDTPFVRKTEEMCSQKLENPVILEELFEIGSGDIKKSSQEEHQAEMLEKISQATANEEFKDDEISEKKECILSQIHEQAMTEASAGERRIEEEFIVQAEEKISSTESVEVEDHLKEEKSKHEEVPEQTFLRHDEPEEEKLESTDVTSEIKEPVASSESVETFTCVQDEISMKSLGESFDKKWKEEKPTDTVEIREHRVPKEKNLPLLDLNEVIEKAEVEIPKEDEVDLHVTHSIIEDTKQVDGEILDKQEISETIIVSTESSALEHTSTEGEGTQEAISITSNTEAGKLEKFYGLAYDIKTEVEDSKEKIEDEKQKNEETFDKETHEIATKCDDTEAGCSAEDTPVMVHSTTGAGEESSEQSLSEFSTDYSYEAEGNVKSNINYAEEVHDGPRIPDPQHITEEQIIKSNLSYLSPESIAETAKSFHDDGEEKERSKEKDSKDQIIEAGNFIDQLPDLVAENQDFQDDENEAGQSKGKINEESEIAQASKSSVHETNQDNEITEKDYDRAPLTKKEEGKHGMVAVPNLEEHLEKEKREAKKDTHDFNETDTSKEEDIELLTETSEHKETTETEDSNLNSKETETEDKKYRMGYRLESEEELEGKDSKEKFEEVYDDDKNAGKDEDSEKHIIQEESTVVVIPPQLIGEEASKSSKEDKHHEQVCKIIQTAVGVDEDNKKQAIEEDSLIADSFQVTTAGEDTREQLKEEIDNFKNQFPPSVEEGTLKESYKEDEVCKIFKIAVPSKDKEKRAIDEYATSDLSSLPVGEKVISESSKECGTKVEDSNIELKEQIEATDTTEEPKQDILKDREETSKNIDAFTKHALDAETLPKESNEILLEPSLFPYVSEKETNKDILEKEEPTMIDSETASAAVAATVLKCSKQTESEGDKQVEHPNLTTEEKGLATTETKGAMSGSGDINVNEKSANLGVSRDTEILSVINEAGEKVEYAMPDTESEDQTEEIEEHKLTTSNVNTTLDETLSHNKEFPFIAQSPEKMSLQKEDEPIHLKDDSELSSQNFGINHTNEEVEKHSHEEVSMPPESTTVRYIYGSEDVGILKEEGATEMPNQSDNSVSEILKDKDVSMVGDQETKSENEKPLNEGSECIEALGTFNDNEKDVETENPAEKLEANLKDFVDEEKATVELKAEIHSQESGASNTEEACTNEEEVCEIIQTAVGGDEDNKKQAIEKDSLIEDSLQVTTAGEDTREQIKEEVDNFKNQSPPSVQEGTLKESYKEDEVCKEFKIAVPSTDKENQTIDEYATRDLSSLTVGEKVISKSSKECDTKAIDLKEEVEDSNLELNEQIEATDNTEERKLEIIKDREETAKNIDAFTKDALDAETLPKESNEILLEPSLFPYVSEKETNKDILEKEEPTMIDSETASAAVTATVLKCSKQTESEGDKQVEDPNLTTEEKGLATTETKGTMSGSGDINVNEKPANLGASRDTEILSVINEAGEKVEYAMPDTESEDQTEEIEKHKLTTSNVNTTLDENLSQNKEIPFIVQSPEKMSLQKEDEPICLKDDSELSSQDFGINLTNEEVEKHSHEELSMPPESSTVRYISGSEDVGILKEEGATEMPNQSDNSSEILKDKDVSIVGDEEAKSENEKPLNEGSECIEALGTFNNSEKDVEQENPAEKLEANLKDFVEEEKTAVELKAEICSQESGPSNTKEACTLEEENLESADPGKELECAAESVPENPGNETLTEPGGTQFNENNTVQYQNTESIEQQITESEVSRKKEIDKEVEPILDDEDNISGTQSANETINDFILTEEVSEIPMVSEIVDEKENSTEQIIQVERDTTKPHSVSSGHETVHEVENCDPAQVRTIKLTDSVAQIETVILENEGHPVREEDESPLTKAFNESATERQCDEKPVDFSIRAFEVSEENAKEESIEQINNYSAKFDIASMPVVKENISGEPQSDNKPGEGFNGVTDDRSLQPIVKSETSLDGEGVDSMKLIETSDSTSKISTIECEDVNKEDVTGEKQLADEIEEIENASQAVLEIKDQCDKEINETGRSLAVEEPNAEGIEEKKHEHVIMNINEKGDDESINRDDSFGTKTTEVTCLQNEELTTLDLSKPIEDIQKIGQNNSLKEEGHTSTEDSKFKSQEDVSKLSNVDYPSSEENSQLTIPAELEASKAEAIMDLRGSNKIDDCSTTTRSFDEGTLLELSENSKKNSHLHCDEVLIVSEETHMKEANLEIPEIELISDKNQCEGNKGIKHEILNEEVSIIAKKVDEIESIPKQIIEEERGTMEHHTISPGDETVDEVENSDLASLENLQPRDSSLQLETVNSIEEPLIKEGDASPITKAPNEVVMEIQDNKKPVYILESEVSEENSEEGIIVLGDTCFDQLNTAFETVVTEEKSLEEPQPNDKPEKGFISDTKENTLQPIATTETCPEGEGVEDLKFEETSDSMSKFSTIECDDEDKGTVFVEKQVTDEIEDTKEASHAVFEDKDRCIKEIHETVRSLPMEEPNAEEFQEAIKQEHANSNIIENRVDENTIINDSFGIKIAEEICLQNEEPTELAASKLIDSIQKDSQNETLEEEGNTLTKDSKVKSQEDVSELNNFDSSPSEKNNELTKSIEHSSQEASKHEEFLDLEGLNKDDYCSTTKIEEVAPDLVVDLDTATTNYNKGTTITKRDEETTTNLSVRLATGSSTEEAVHENVGENIEEASETHPRELVHEIEKEIVIAVADNQDSLMECEKQEHTSLESASESEVKEDLKLGQEVSPETETSPVKGSPHEEIPNDDRKIKEDEERPKLVFDKHIAVESITSAERTTINDEREHTESKDSLEESTRESDMKPDEEEVDTTICKSEDETVKPNELLDIRSSDITMLQRGSAADPSGENETTQTIQKLEKTSYYASEKQIPREVEPNERKETMVATGDKDDQLVVEDTFAKTLGKTKLEDLNPETTTTVESEQEQVKCDAEEITDDVGEEKISLSYLLQKSTGQVDEEKESTLAKEEMQTEKADTLHEEEAKSHEEKYEEEEGDEHKKDDSGSDAPVMVEASKDMDEKVSHKKHHGILSGVGSKVKHSISKVKKAITGKSSHSKPLSPK